jgi:PD-(D/E)XK nuclease superfamily domain
MSPRDTRTGSVLEDMVLPALARGGYEVQRQALVHDRPGGHRHKVDAVASKDGRHVLISLKWQQVSGTAEQKVPFEVICLAIAVRADNFARAYLVLGGEGWTLRDYFTSGALAEHLKDCDDVEIVTLENFIALANSGRL